MKRALFEFNTAEQELKESQEEQKIFTNNFERLETEEIAVYASG